MNKIKTFFYIFIKSMTSPAWYKEMLETKFAYSLKYLLFMAFLISIVATTFIVVSVVPQVDKFKAQAAIEVKNWYPDDLVVTATNGEWSINRPEPFIIPLPAFIKDLPEDATVNGVETTKMPENLLVMYKLGEIEDLDRLSTLTLINSKNMLARTDEGIKVVPIKDLPNGQLTKTDYLTGVTQVEKVAKFTTPVIVVATFVGSIFGFTAGKMFYLLFPALILWLVFALSKKDVGFGKSYRVGLHAHTLPMILQFVLGMAGVELPVPAWVLLSTIAIGIYMVVTTPKNTPAAAPVNSVNTPVQQ